MSDDIKSLVQSFEKDIILKLEEENRNLKLKIKKLEEIRYLTDEEQVCIKQIEILREKSDERELNLDEVKRLDLLVKNLKIIRDVQTLNIEANQITESEEEDLVKLARG